MPLKAYSGKFVARVGDATHKKLASYARSKGISLNNAVKAVLEQGFKNLEKKPDKNLVV